jgi:hypothetical protein
MSEDEVASWVWLVAWEAGFELGLVGGLTVFIKLSEPPPCRCAKLL